MTVHEEAVKAFHDDKEMINIALMLESQYKRVRGSEPLPMDIIKIVDYAKQESIKRRLYADIDSHGVSWAGGNGRQSYRKENKAVAAYAKYCNEQAKLLKALGLGDIGDDTDEDDDFDDI